ncbi:MAG TPA: porin [Holophaga sp.]|nr:porin [Holophaga sp.]
MKPLSTLLLCAGLPVLAQAPASPLSVQTDAFSATLYGLLDAGVGYMPHSLNWDATLPPSTAPAALTGRKKVLGMFAGGVSQSRWGIRASADLGGGWKAIAHLEACLVGTTGVVGNSALGLATNTPAGPNWAGDSAVNNQLFSRACYGGVSSDRYGTLTFGRNISLMMELAVAYDPLGAAQLFSPLGFSGTYGGGGATENSRVDNSLKYKIKVGAFSSGALYKFGNVAGAMGAQSGVQAQAGWERGALGVQFSYQGCKDAFSLGSPNGTTQPLGTVVATAFDTEAWMATFKAGVGPVTLKAGYQHLTYTNPSHPVEDQALTSLFGVPIARPVNVTRYATGAKQVDVVWLGGAWDVTPKLAVQAGYYHVRQNDYSGGTATASAKSGTSRFASLLVDYRITKRFDVYGGHMGNEAAGGMAIPGYFASNGLTGVGFRFSF